MPSDWLFWKEKIQYKVTIRYDEINEINIVKTYTNSLGKIIKRTPIILLTFLEFKCSDGSTKRIFILYFTKKQRIKIINEIKKRMHAIGNYARIDETEKNLENSKWEEIMNESVTCSIWGLGPGRPFDNPYLIKKIEIANDNIFLSFDGDEECHIFSPQGIHYNDKEFIVESAYKITWKNCSYGKSKTENALIYEEYIYVNKFTVQKVSRGALVLDMHLKPSGNAFELYGDLRNIKIVDHRFSDN